MRSGQRPKLSDSGHGARRLQLRRPAAVRWLGHWSIIALTKNHLTATNWTTLNITTKNMKLTFDNSAVVAGPSICSPIVRFLAEADAQALNASD